MKLARTEKFKRCYSDLPAEVRKITDRKLMLFQRNPHHPSLRVKKMKGTQNIWEASITMNYRFTFELYKDVILLRIIGKHDEALRNP